MLKKLKGWGFASLFLFCAFVSAPKADAAFYYYPPYTFHGNYYGVPYGYGHFGFAYGVGYGSLPVFYNPFGYSYYNYYGQIPYYATYGVISYSVETGQSGYAFGYSNLGDASQSSRRYCGPDDCQPVVWVQGGCAAVAVGKETKQLGWAYANDKYDARSRAMHACHRSGAADCEVKAWVCSF